VDGFFVSLALSSQSGIFLYRSVACDVSFESQLEAPKSDTVRGRNELFIGRCRSRRWMASCCNHFRIFFVSLALSSQSGIFLYRSIACDVSFESQLEAPKSDTVRGSNELFIGRCRSRRWMDSCCNHFRIFFVSLAFCSQSAIFLYCSVACNVSFDSHLEPTKSDTVRGSNELFMRRCRSRRWMASCCNHFPIFFVSLALSSQSGIFLYRSVAWDVSFESQLEAPKSDTVRGSNELFIARCRSRRWMASCCNHFRIFFVSLALSSQSGIFLYRSVACDVSFESQLEAPKSDTVRGSNELFIGRCRSGLWMASCCNHFRIFFVSLAFSSQSAIFLYRRVACNVSFDSHLEAPKSDTVRGSNELFMRCCRSRRWMASSSLWP
jgi:hypothetical protein